MKNRLNRAIIKEELVALTGDYKSAIILNQFIYWSERVDDFDEFIDEENQRLQKHGFDKIEIEHGWIYKKAEDLASETMLNLQPKAMRLIIKKLVESQWVTERNNPKYAWDRTLQYHVNITKIQNDLFSIGYNLDSYRVKISLPKGEKENSKGMFTSVQNIQKEKAIPEITTEITSETTSSLSSSFKKEKDMDFPKNQEETSPCKQEKNIELQENLFFKPTPSDTSLQNRTSAPGKSKAGKKQEKSSEEMAKVAKWFEETFWQTYPHRNGIRKTKVETLNYMLEHMTMDELRKVDRGLKNFLKDKSVQDGIGIPDPIRFVRPRRGETTALYESYQEAPVQPEKLDPVDQQMLNAGVSREFLFGKRGK